ncbi:MAG: M15 family metallopeptidase [Phascolarctobacterium faecium]
MNDPDGYGITCKIGGNRYSRAFFGPDREKPFRIPQPSDWQGLKKAASEAVIPSALTTGKQAELVDVTKAITGIKLDLRYAGTNNCFGMSIVDVKKAYLDRVAAGALGRVQKRLADYGYGLVIWEAYRPWSVSKLAYDAFQMIKNKCCQLRSRVYNTGRAVDVSLIILKQVNQ